MKEESKVCCFLGHRKIAEAENLKVKLYEIIESLIIHNNADVFLFGSKSEFDRLCYRVVTELKEKYPHIKRIYVRAECPYSRDEYKKYYLEYYEDTYFPERAINAGRATYVERNYEMIDKADFCVMYYIDSYAPPERRNSRLDLLSYQPRSGTGIAYEYAQRKKKKIINIAAKGRYV